jgi:ketosteroid isomerase-like protein
MGGGAAATVQEWFDRFAAGDAGVDLCDPGIRIDNLAEFPITGPYHGHAGVRQWWRDLLDAIDDLRIELDGLEQLDGERVLTTQRIVGRFRHTGIELDARWASIVTVRDGRVVRAIGYGSRRQALRAAGEPEP